MKHTPAILLIMITLLISGVIGNLFSYTMGHTKGVSDGKIEIMSDFNADIVYCFAESMNTTQSNFTIVCRGVYGKK